MLLTNYILVCIYIYVIKSIFINKQFKTLQNAHVLTCDPPAKSSPNSHLFSIQGQVKLIEYEFWISFNRAIELTFN